jgi:hypothetical protein
MQLKRIINNTILHCMCSSQPVSAVVLVDATSNWLARQIACDVHCSKPTLRTHNDSKY